MLTIVVAYDAQRGIGYKGSLPWSPIPDDFKHFKVTTMGYPVIMGRNTWESLPDNQRPLPGRQNIVITRLHPPSLERDLIQGKCNAYPSLEVALEGKTDAFLIGGGQLYKYALDNNLVDLIIASELKGTYPADTFFPAVSWPGAIQKEFDLFNIVHYRR